jgi:hypothetical protein
MTDSPLQRLFWRVVDALDYLLTLVRLRILDALAGPEPETPADLRRKRDREQLERAFPEIHCKEPDAAISHSTDRVSPEDGSRSMGGDAAPRLAPP